MTALEEFVIDPFDDWRDFAECKGHRTLFFAKKSERPQARDRREAKARNLCRACPVELICRDFAREHREYGFWGGESEEDRHLAGFNLCSPIGVRARTDSADDSAATAC